MRVISASLLWPVAGVGEQVVGIAGAHEAGTRQGQGDAGGVDGDPTAAPLLGDIGCGAGTAGGIENEVAGVGGHEEAALDDRWPCLNYIPLFRLLVPSIGPDVVCILTQ